MKLLDDQMTQAIEHFKTLVTKQNHRIDRISSQSDWIDYSKKETITIGICYGDGIGELILEQALRVLNEVLKPSLEKQKIVFQVIDGLTIENRVAHNQAIPDAVLSQIKSCDVILKGPTTTPQKGGPWPNIESANVAMRRELDLFANVRPVKVPEINIDWHFFRENTEGEYALGSHGLHFDDFCMDFKVTSAVGTERICRAAFEFAKKNNKQRVTVITKSNIMKATDGLFSEIACQVAKEYASDGIRCDEYYIDIMTANLINDQEAPSFEVMVLPNLYGDILTDQAAQIQGGVGTAGSANIGKQFAMFEAIHGSAPRLIEAGLSAYANPSSILKATVLLLQHIGYLNEAKKLDRALDITTLYEKKYRVNHHTKTTGEMFTSYVLDWVASPDLNTTWLGYQAH